MASGNELRGEPEPGHFPRYDALPRRFRRLLQLAHTNFQVGWVEIYLELGEGLAWDEVRRILWRERQSDILRHYGPDHPELAQ